MGPDAAEFIVKVFVIITLFFTVAGIFEGIGRLMDRRK